MSIRTISRAFGGLVTVGGTVALVACLGWQAWRHFGPVKPRLSHMRQEIADKLLPQIIEDLRKSRGEARSAVLLHLANDPTDYVSDRLRALIEESGVLDLRGRRLHEKIERALHLRVSESKDIARELNRARDEGVDALLLGRINTHESYADGTKLDMQITLMDVSNRAVLLDQSYSKQLKPGILDAAATRDELGRFTGAERFLGWLLAVLLLPVFTIGFIRAMLRRESNGANAFTLGLYTAVDALLVYLLLGASMTTRLSVLVFLALAGAAFAYNAFVMSHVQRADI
ncbi:MAG: hypothetical protein GX456_07045 [Verrucomicrobia bacterium]|nr:hypothetical protein [Verrucomicrobiota bacterium]